MATPSAAPIVPEPRSPADLFDLRPGPLRCAVDQEVEPLPEADPDEGHDEDCDRHYATTTPYVD
jgi:hypothetical protein